MDEKEQVIDNSVYSHYVGVKFALGAKAYFFGIKNIPLNIGDKVVVETARGIELGEVSMQKGMLPTSRNPARPQSPPEITMVRMMTHPERIPA